MTNTGVTRGVDLGLARVAAGLSARAVAWHLHVSRTALSVWEADHRPVDPELLARWEDALRVATEARDARRLNQLARLGLDQRTVTEAIERGELTIKRG